MKSCLDIGQKTDIYKHIFRHLWKLIKMINDEYKIENYYLFSISFLLVEQYFTHIDFFHFTLPLQFLLHIK